MKILGQIPKIFGVYDRQKNIDKIEKTSAAKMKKDVISISKEAKDYQTAMKTVKMIPDIREDRVSELTEKLGSGKYDINGTEVADRILKSIVDKKV